MAGPRSLLTHHAGVGRPACTSPHHAAGCTTAGPALGYRGLCGRNLISSGWNDDGAQDINGPGRGAVASEAGKPQAMPEAAAETWAQKIHIQEVAEAGSSDSRSLKGQGLAWSRPRGKGQR